MILPNLHPKPALKSLSGCRRNWAKAHKYYLTPDNRINAALIQREMNHLELEIRRTVPLVRERKVGCSVLKRLLKMRDILDLAMLDQVALPFDVRKQKFNIVRPRGAAATIDGWDHLRVPEDFRVDTHFELWELFERFQFPAKMISKSRHTFTGEEVFLFGMYRLCNVTKLSNETIAHRFGYVHRSQASECFHCFLSFMVNNWGYLLTNNFDFWVPYLRECALSIRLKCIELGVTFPANFNIIP
jgi:hypothetical protein